MRIPSYLIILLSIITIIRFSLLESSTPHATMYVLVSVNFICISVIRLIELSKGDNNGKKP